MNAERHAHIRAAFGQVEAAVPVFRAGRDRDEGFDAGVAGALDHGVAVGVEVFVAEVAVGVYHETGDRRLETRDKRQETRDWRLETRDKEQETGDTKNRRLLLFLIASA